MKGPSCWLLLWGSDRGGYAAVSALGSSVFGRPVHTRALAH
jgi:hypothetical protein